jgi:hypothetical protein
VLDKHTGRFSGDAENVNREVFLRGVLTDVVDEAYRRTTVPYEDKKIEENGDL